MQTRKDYYHFSSVYSHTELKTYFNTLNAVLTDSRHRLTRPVEFTFTNMHEHMSLSYSPEENMWSMRNKNRLDVIESHNIGITLADQVAAKFGLNDKYKNVVLGTVVNADSVDQAALNQTMRLWMSGPSWSAMHMPNKTKANIRDWRKNTWLKVAVKMGEPDLVIALQDLMWFYKRNRKQTAISLIIMLAAVGGLIASGVLVNPVGIALCSAAFVFEIFDLRYNLSAKDAKRVEKAIRKHADFENANHAASDLSSLAVIMSHLSENDRRAAIDAMRNNNALDVNPVAANAVIAPEAHTNEVELVIDNQINSAAVMKI